MMTGNIGMSNHLVAECLDCGLPYEDFQLDTTIPDDQWLMIHPEGEGGLLCAGCIVKRAAKLPRIIAVRARFEFAEEYTHPNQKYHDPECKPRRKKG